MRSIRWKRALSFVVSCALCMTMNGVMVYAEEAEAEESVVTEVSEEGGELQEVSADESCVECQDVGETVVVEEISADEVSVDEADVTEEHVGTASMASVSVDSASHRVYLGDYSAVIRESEGNTILEIPGKTVSYCDLSGNSVSMTGIQDYAVAAGNTPGQAGTGSITITMESGTVQGIYGSANTNGTGGLKLQLNGGRIEGEGISLVTGAGIVSGNTVIHVGNGVSVNKLNTVNRTDSYYSQTTFAQGIPVQITGSDSTYDSFVFHENTASGNGMTRTGVKNYIDFTQVSENSVLGTLSGNVILCDTLSLSENEVLKMNQGTLTTTVNGKIDNHGLFEIYRGAQFLNPETAVLSGNQILICEADFTTLPGITVPADNRENQSATVFAGELLAYGVSLSPARLVQHASLSSNSSISVNTTTEDGKGEYVYSFSYQTQGSAFAFSPDLLFYDHATGQVISGNAVPDEKNIAGRTAKLIYSRYVGSVTSVLRLNRGGAVYATLAIPYGSHGSALEELIRTQTGGNPEIEGKTFAGWYALVGDEEKSIYDSGFEISKTVKNLYAKWTGADKVVLAIRDFADGTLVRRLPIYADTFLSDTSAIDYSRDFYNRIGNGVYRDQQQSPMDEGIPYSSATRVGSVVSVSENVYTVYAKYEFDATRFYDGDGSEFTFAFTRKAKVLEEDGEPVVSYPYTGRQIQPSVRVKHGKVTLKENDDYTVQYEENINATGNYPGARVIITGRGIYTGSVTLNFAILPKSIKSVRIGVIGSIPLNASEAEYQDQILVTDNGLVVDPSEYTLVFKPKMGPDGETEVAGNGKVRVYGNGGNYIASETVCVSKTANFINTEGKTDISSDFNVDVVQTQFTYTGNLVKPSAVVGNSTRVLEEGKDYKMVYRDNLNVGTQAKAYAVGCGKYYGITQPDTFEITQKELRRVAIKSVGSVTYTGNHISGLKLSVTDDKNILVEGVDYTVSFDEIEGNKNVSTGTVRAKVTIEAVKAADGTYTGNYRGIKNATFKIKRRNINNSNAVKVYKDEFNWSYPYTGSAVKPVIGLSYGGVMLEEGKDYTVTYKNNVKSFLTTGKIASLTIKGKNNFTGSRTFMFFIF